MTFGEFFKKLSVFRGWIRSIAQQVASGTLDIQDDDNVVVSGVTIMDFANNNFEVVQDGTNTDEVIIRLDNVNGGSF